MIADRVPTVLDMIDTHARNRATVTAFQDSERVLTWRELSTAVRRGAQQLVRDGIRKDDAVAGLFDSSVQAWSDAFSVLAAGGVVTPLNTMSTPETLALLLGDSGATAIIVSERYTDVARAAMDLIDVQDRPRWIVMPPVDAEDTGAVSDLPAVGPADRFNIIYSSGTTGRPKGIVHSHRARASMGAAMASAFRASSSARLLLLTPPHTNGSWMVVLPMLYVGGTTILTDGFSVEGFTEAVNRDRPTLTFIVPTIAHRVVSAPEAKAIDWSSFDMVLTAGAPMAADLKRRFIELTGGRLGELWGFTEGVASCVQPQEMADHTGTAGRAVPLCELRVVDEAGVEVGAGETGELVGRSDFMLTEYHGRPDATADLVWTSPDGGQFLRTGDLGSLDADGWVTIRGRSKDMIISGGVNVFPVDIEDVVARHPDVEECAVIAVADEDWGERPLGCVVLRPGRTTSAGEFLEWVNQRVAKQQRLVDVVTVAALPRNTLGKVVKADLVRDVDQLMERVRDHAR